MKTNTVTGLALVAFPLAVQLPFNLLAVRYSYPDILSRSTDEILTRFHSGGGAMISTWYAYALCTLGLAFVATLLPSALNQQGTPAARLSVVAGTVAAVAQLIGLLRWTLVVPFLADAWVAHPEQHATLEIAFQLQHRLFGTMIGEHVGQLFMAGWTASAAFMLFKANAPKAITALGAVSAALFLVGLHAPTAALLAFIAWSLWAISAGVFTARRSQGKAEQWPAPHSSISTAR